MIDTDKYEGCQTDSLVLHKGYLCPTIFMDVDGSGKNVPTLGRGIVDVQADIPEHYLQLLVDAPLLLAEVKRLREFWEACKRRNHVVYRLRLAHEYITNLDSDAEQLIANAPLLLAKGYLAPSEVKRLREAMWYDDNGEFHGYNEWLKSIGEDEQSGWY